MTATFLGEGRWTGLLLGYLYNFPDSGSRPFSISHFHAKFSLRISTHPACLFSAVFMRGQFDGGGPPPASSTLCVMPIGFDLLVEGSLTARITRQPSPLFSCCQIDGGDFPFISPLTLLPVMFVHNGAPISHQFSNSAEWEFGLETPNLPI
jgi:hypothetical protein